MDADVWLESFGEDDRRALHDLLAISLCQADRGEVVPFDVEAIIAEGQARRAARCARAAAE